jgi:hypothetical protein
MTKKSKNVFIIKGVDTSMVNIKFGINLKAPNTTRIEDLNTNTVFPKTMVFLDEAKKSHKCNVSSVEGFGKKSDIVYNCFWDRNSIPRGVRKIGCPIRYEPSRAIKTYNSEISRDTYSISQKVTTAQQSKIREEEDDRIAVVVNDNYVTDGAFCSFNCCMAFIESKKTDPVYNFSESLLLKMYGDIFPEQCESERTITPAPHWRKLKSYGGELNIDEFRASFNKIEYYYHGVVNCVPIGHIYEELLKF